MNDMTEAETIVYELLIRLGDNEEQARKAIEDARKKESSNEFYDNAYRK